MSSRPSTESLARAGLPGGPPERHTVRFLGEPDAFADVLSHLRVGSVAYCRSELTAPWGLDLPFEDGIRFHYPAEGGCWLALNGQQVWLDCGDIALVVSGSAHRLLDASTSPASPVEAYSREVVRPNLYRMAGGGGGAATVLVCCRVEVREGQQILRMLPTPLVVRAQDPAGAGIQETLRLMSSEAGNAGLGRAAVISRLAEVVIAHLMRAWMETEGSDSWTPALRDPQVGPVIAAIHREPGRSWTLQSLADIARVSRSTFAARFTQRVGISPARYIAQLRMRVAMRRLKSERSSLAQIAADLGISPKAPSRARSSGSIASRPAPFAAPARTNSAAACAFTGCFSSRPCRCAPPEAPFRHRGKRGVRTR